MPIVSSFGWALLDAYDCGRKDAWIFIPKMAVCQVEDVSFLLRIR